MEITLELDLKRPITEALLWQILVSTELKDWSCQSNGIKPFADEAIAEDPTPHQIG